MYCFVFWVTINIVKSVSQDDGVEKQNLGYFVIWMDWFVLVLEEIEQKKRRWSWRRTKKRLRRSMKKKREEDFCFVFCRLVYIC